MNRKCVGEEVLLNLHGICYDFPNPLSIGFMDDVAEDQTGKITV